MSNRASDDPDDYALFPDRASAKVAIKHVALDAGTAIAPDECFIHPCYIGLFESWAIELEHPSIGYSLWLRPDGSVR